MTLEEITTEACNRIVEDNPGCKDSKANRVFKNIMDGTVVTVSFVNARGENETNHVYFGRNETRAYRKYVDILQDVSTRERVWFFRFIELAGVGGVIAFFLVLVFSVLLSVLAFVNRDNSTILEVVKLSFTLILGFFFGSQTASQKRSP